MPVIIAPQYIRGSGAGGQPDAEARAGIMAGVVAPVLGNDAAAMAIDDLLGDRKAETRMRAEFFARWPLGIEALEDRLQLAFGNSRPVIVNRDNDESAVAAAIDAHRAAATALSSLSRLT